MAEYVINKYFKIAISLILSCCFIATAFSQNQKVIDSLNQVIDTTSSSKVKVNAWILIAAEYRQIDADLTSSYARKGIELAEAINYPQGKADGLYQIGFSHVRVGRYNEALNYFEQIEALSKSINYLEGLSNAYNGFGLVYDDISNHAKALEYHLLSLEIMEKLGDQKGESRAYSNIGIIYQNQEEYDKALEMYFKALRINEGLNEKLTIAITNFNIGGIYYLKQDHETALSHYHKTLEIVNEIGDIYGMGMVNFSMGNIHYDKEVYDEAMSSYERSVSFFERCDALSDQTSSLIGIGKIHFQRNDWELSRRYFLKALEISQNIGYVSGIEQSAEMLVELEKTAGNYKRALTYLDLANEMEDSIINTEQTKALAILGARYAFQKEKDSIQYVNDRERLEFEKKVEKRRGVQNATLVALALLTVLLFVVLCFYRKLKVLNNAIKAKNSSLETANKAKNRLFSIISHDMRGPMTVVLGVNDLMKRHLAKSDIRPDKALDELIEMQETSSINAYHLMESLFTWALKEQERIPYQPEIVNVKECFVENLTVLKPQAIQKNISLQMGLEDDIESFVDKNMFLTILRNLVSNAIKFTHEGGTVSLSAEEEDDIVRIGVKDDGVGMAENKLKALFGVDLSKITHGTNGEKGTGLGLNLVYDFVKMNRGDISVESSLGKGTTFRLAFPKSREMTSVG